ncbi:D-glycero-alpha-D-manno-heptose-1,7-bisphosphate 7-phosphatase [Bacteroidota bacterium]
MSLRNLTFDNSWTLFLDRDGVINKQLPGEYVTSWNEFEFIKGVPDAFKIFSKIFDKIIVITNQQGIGKGLMTENQLQAVHENMIKEIERAGGRIDAVYFSPYMAKDNHPSRKPNTGMAEIAKNEFPEIDFDKTIMVGDSVKDMEFGKNLNMYTVFIKSNDEEKPSQKIVDETFETLFDFANSL